MRNEQQLQALPTPEQLYEGRVEGLFPSNQLPVPRRLALRPGARVLFVKNDADNRWVNGTAGIVSACHPDRIIVDCAERCGPLVVHPVGWERYGYAFDPKSGGVHKTVTGRFVQVPLILGWAATVHRCQGLTLNRTHVDLSPGVFSPGQAYVALSRCRTLGGLTLERPVRERDIIIDPRVIRFLESQLTHRAA